MLGETQELLELFRVLPTPVFILLFVPLVLLVSPISPVQGINDFPVFRMQQYDLHGIRYGSRSATVNLEARPFTSANLARRCAVARLSEVNIERLKVIINDGVGALLVLLPRDWKNISEDDLQYYQQLEVQFLEIEIPIPVYFAFETDDLADLYKRIAASVTSDSAASAVQALTTVASANAFHLVSSIGESKPMNDFPIISLQGKLSGQGLEDQLPTVAIVAHYDSFGLIPKLSKGADSNGSGVVALLELARILSRLYDQSNTRAKYNIIFFLAGGGKFNFQGTKKWIDESLEATDISLLPEVDYVICLDSLGYGNSLTLHVSKPPKEGTQAHALVEEIKKVTNELYPHVKFNVTHKKVNLAEDMLPWEHEKFSLRRLPAGTFSHYETPRINDRGSMFDNSADPQILKRNIKIIGEGLARHIFNLSGKAYSKQLEVFSGVMEPDVGFISSWLDQLSSEPRSAQLLSKDHRLFISLEQTLIKHLKEVRRVIVKADKKDPDYLFYDGFEAKMSVYSVKPALFDLFLAGGIAIYMGLVYLVMENFSLLSEILPKPVSNGKMHSG